MNSLKNRAHEVCAGTGESHGRTWRGGESMVDRMDFFFNHIFKCESKISWNISLCFVFRKDGGGCLEQKNIYLAAKVHEHLHISNDCALL